MDEKLADAIKAAMGEYPGIRKVYYENVFTAIYDFLDTSEGVAKQKNYMKRAMVNAFQSTSDIGWLDGGGEFPVDEDTSAWVTASQAAEIGNIDALFETLKLARKEGDVNKFDTATARADGYCLTLDVIYNHCKISAAGNLMLTLAGTDGEKSCHECQKYKGKRHKASWWIANNLIPGIGSAYTCGGWNCYHVLIDDKGKLWTL
jgi:hypothetical protein